MLDGNVTISVRRFQSFSVLHYSRGNPMMARIGFCLALLLGLFASEADAQFPDFLPPYYLEALKYDGIPLVLTSRGDKEGIKRAVFETTGRLGWRNNRANSLRQVGMHCAAGT